MKSKAFLVPPPTLYELKKRQQRIEIEQAEREYMKGRKEKGDSRHSEINESEIVYEKNGSRIL